MRIAELRRERRKKKVNGKRSCGEAKEKGKAEAADRRPALMAELP